MSESQHLSTYIERPAAEVYAYAMNPANLPNWASGLGGSIEQRDGRWFAESPMGELEVTFVPDNPYFVLDHEVKLSDGTTFNNPMRVIGHDTGCEVLFTLVRQPDQSNDDYEADATAIRTDLATLKELLER
ncbi:MAG TPA: SRPBCC family protein [Propionibacteriaceae bacterium]